MHNRMPVVAGQFYPSNEDILKKELNKYIKIDNPQKAIAVISPHAGYIYSGGVAGFVFSKTIIPNKIVILSPNHTGLGAHASIMVNGNWMIPGGKVKVDSILAEIILEESNSLENDILAHQEEHSIEVQLPFLKFINPNVEIVPICLSHLSLPQIENLGHAIANAIKQTNEDVLIVSSSDMNHYQSVELTKKKDFLAIDNIIKLDAIGLLETCSENGITMCGVIPTAVTIIASKQLGAKKAELLKYATSGEITGDHSAVVGYAGIAIR